MDITGPCFNGNCTNTIGSFSCSCPPERNGHRCQYDNRCADGDLCTNGTMCVETLVNTNGYVCDSTPDDMAAIVTLDDGMTLAQLDEALYDLVKPILYGCMCLLK